MERKYNRKAMISNKPINSHNRGQNQRADITMREDTGQQNEYMSIRVELSTILSSRYLIFTALTSLYGLIFAFVVSSGSVIFIALLPLILLTITFPTLLINHFLTLHFRRIDSYLSTLEKRAIPEFSFHKSYPYFRKLLKVAHKSVYRRLPYGIDNFLPHRHIPHPFFLHTSLW